MGTEADDDDCWAQLAANEGWRDDGWGSRATTAADAPPPDSKRQRVLTIVGGAPPQGDLQGFPPGFAGWCTAKEVHHGKLDSPQTGVNGPQTVQPLQTRSPNIEPGKQLSFAGILGRAPTTRPVAPPPKPSAAKSAPQASGEGDDASTAASTLTNGAWALMMSQRANPFGTSGVPKQLVRIIDLAGAAVQPGMRDHVVALLKPDDNLACANVMMRALKCASKGQLTPCEPPSWVRAPWKKLPKPQRAAAFKRLGEQWKEALSDTHFRRWVAATRTGTQHNPSRGENRLFNSLVAALDEGAHGDGTTAGTKRARARVDTLANGQKTNALAAEMLQSRAALAKATAQVAAGSWREHNRECAGQRNKLSAQMFDYTSLAAKQLKALQAMVTDDQAACHAIAQQAKHIAQTGLGPFEPQGDEATRAWSRLGSKFASQESQLEVDARIFQELVAHARELFEAIAQWCNVLVDHAGKYATIVSSGADVDELRRALKALEDEFGKTRSESESGRRRRFLEIAQQLQNGAGRWHTAAAALVRSESAGSGDAQSLAYVLRAQDSELSTCYRNGQSHLAHVSKRPVTALAARAGGAGAEPHATFNASAERTPAAAQAVQGLVDVWGAGEPLLVQHQGATAAAQHTAWDQHEQQLGHAEPLAIYGSLLGAGVDCRDRAAKIEAGQPVDLCRALVEPNGLRASYVACEKALAFSSACCTLGGNFLRRFSFLFFAIV